MIQTAALVLILLATPSLAAGICRGYGPQAPRDIGLTAGDNRRTWSVAPPPTELNLCNIHTHTNAEHKGPGFFLPAGDGEHGGWRCHGSEELSAAELLDPAHGHGGFHGVAPGDTMEVHWVFTSCAVQPGEGLGACATESCANPALRVESQVFLVVNDPEAADFGDFTYHDTIRGGLHQPRGLPEGTGEPVAFLGSTTGPGYSEQICSPYQVTWSVRPQCMKLDIASLYRWGEDGNVFNEDHSHGVRPLVSAPELLSPIR